MQMLLLGFLLSYIHDLGFIPKLQDGKRGFKVMLGGGLGSQPRHADKLYDFIEAEEIIPLIESVLRVFSFLRISRRAEKSLVSGESRISYRKI